MTMTRWACVKTCRLLYCPLRSQRIFEAFLPLLDQHLSDLKGQAFAITDQYSHAFDQQSTGDGPPMDATLNDDADTPRAIGNEEMFYDVDAGV